MIKLMKISILLMLGVGLAACGGGGGGGGGSGTRPTGIAIKISTSAGSPLSRVSALVAPSCPTSLTAISGGDSVPIAGCPTATNFSGVFSAARLTNSTGGTPVRILGGGTETAFASVFKTGLFNLLSSPSVSSSADNLESGSGTYDVLWLESQMVEYTVTLSHGTYQVRTYFVDQPASGDTGFASCGFTYGQQSQIDALASLTTGAPTGIKAGDILVCKRTTASVACAESDFNWVVDDGSGGSIRSTTRDSSAKQVTLNSRYHTASSCTGSGGSPTAMNWGHADLAFKFASAKSINATNSGGIKTYTSGSSSGTKATFNITLGATTAVAAESVAGPYDANENNFLSKIEKIQLQPVLWGSEQGASPAAGGLGGALDASLSITLE